MNPVGRVASQKTELPPTITVQAEIIDLFATGETFYYSDIFERLRIDFEMVIDICHELQEEGAIGVNDHAV